MNGPTTKAATSKTPKEVSVYQRYQELTLKTPERNDIALGFLVIGNWDN